MVLAHGFLGHRTKPRILALADALAEQLPVFVFDLRGHGESGGRCTGSALEALDVSAVDSHVRSLGHTRVVTVGGSLGGIAVLRAAADLGAGDAVVAISVPADWAGRTRPVRTATWRLGSPVGRALARAATRTRIDRRWENPEPPVELVTRIRVPLLIVHGDDDHFFPIEDARRVFAAAREPKRLIVVPGFGHAEDGYTREFGARLAGEIGALWP